jgi:hypothetical protein
MCACCAKVDHTARKYQNSRSSYLKVIYGFAKIGAKMNPTPSNFVLWRNDESSGSEVRPAEPMLLTRWPPSGRGVAYSPTARSWTTIDADEFDSLSANGVCINLVANDDLSDGSWCRRWYALIRTAAGPSLIVNGVVLALSHGVNVRVKNVVPFLRQADIENQRSEVIASIRYLSFFPTAKDENFVPSDFFEFVAEALQNWREPDRGRFFTHA